MRGLLSLDQELRAAHRAKGQKGGSKSNRPSELKETERPWQEDIEQIQQTMRELLRAVAGLSGVELPGLPPGLQDDEGNPPRLDIRSLKDRIRNDLEGFSIKTTEELTKRAREQAHAALNGFQNEVGDSIEKVAAEFRETCFSRRKLRSCWYPASRTRKPGWEGRLPKSLNILLPNTNSRFKRGFRQRSVPSRPR